MTTAIFPFNLSPIRTPHAPQLIGDAGILRIGVCHGFRHAEEHRITLSVAPRNSFIAPTIRNARSIQARVLTAAAMVHGYGIVHEPSLKSLHIFGKAIDMSITWDGTLRIKKKDGIRKTIRTLPRTGYNHDLRAVGATYGVLKLASDPPHWSSTGH
jgi:hypothetical protein